MFNQVKFRGGYNLKFISAILFAVTFLVGGMFVSRGGALAEGAIVWTVDVTTTGSSCTTAAPICNTIQSAVSASKDGDIININSGDYTITETIIVNKAITIQGAAGFGTRILTSGLNPVFNLNSTLVVLDGLFIQKIDKTNQHLVIITANNVAVKNSKFIGHYAQGDGEVVRAIVPNAGITGYVIDGNYFENLRQPSYLEGAGTVTNNFVKNTRGWVVCVNHAIIFSNNTFEGNAVDIAIIANGQTSSTNYTNIATLSSTNSGAYVENQLIHASAKLGNLIVEAGTNNNINSLLSAVNAAQDGDTIELKSDITIGSQININKALTIDGAGHKITASFIKTDNSNNSAIGIQHSNVTIKNLTEDGTGSTKLHGINIYLSNNVSLDNVTVSNNPNAGMIVNGSTVSVNKITTLNNGWGGINVDQGTDVTAITTLTVNGKSSHTELNSAIWRDDNLKTNVTVVDTNNQYSPSTYTHTENSVLVTGTSYKLNSDISAYNSALATVTEAKYTKESWVAYQIVVLANTVTVANTQAQVNTATANIIAAQANLIVYVAPQNHSGGGSYVPTIPAVPANVLTPDGCSTGNKFSTTTGRNCNAATPATPGNGKVLGAEKFNFVKFMKIGLNGNEVMELQKFLTTLGYDLGDADGKFGAKTKKAVIKFQIANKLVGDGVVGAMTRAILNK